MDKLKHQGSWGELELEKELDLEIDKNLNPGELDGGRSGEVWL